MKTRRIRDPIHGLISFDLENEEIDDLAWNLLTTPEFQRLRRVKQLGVSEFTFPGATHNRFAHSVGVFHIARQLMGIAKTVIRDDHMSWKDHSERVALIAALVHDLGHGPFSHAFEQAEKARLLDHPGAYKDHEDWTAEIIGNPDGEVYRVISQKLNKGVVEEVANLLTSDPQDIYGSVVSSSFDADRLDFLQRDKLMTGSGAGGIDFEWLLDNLVIANDVPLIDDVSIEGNGSYSRETIQTLCFREKALQAAEAFIMARYHLYSQVYFHKTTRGIEKLLTAFLLEVSRAVTLKQVAETGVWVKNPLIEYYKAKKPTVGQYLALDDTVVWSAIGSAVHGKNQRLSMIADRLLNRKLMKVIEIGTAKPTEIDRNRRKIISDEFRDVMGISVFEDRVPLSVYSIEDREQVKPHKRVRIMRDSDSSSVDITMLSRSVAALTEKQELLRYYFLNESDYERVMKVTGGKNAIA